MNATGFLRLCSITRRLNIYNIYKLKCIPNFSLFKRMSSITSIGQSENDPHSFSNPEAVAVTDLHLKLEIDFQKRLLSGYVDLSIERKDSKSDLILDTADLVIHNVRNKNTLSKIPFTLSDPVEHCGSKLEIKLSKRVAKKCVVRVDFETTDKSTALYWLSPEQTHGKKHPYVFSMGQATNSRSMFPCQDTPSVKTPFTATVTVPYELTVLMSALRDGEEMDDDPMMKSYKFIQKVPVPSYLIVLVAGALESRKIGPRSHVWAEREVVEKAAAEFSEFEKILLAAESVAGEYEWGIYDLLVLPASFAYGGMENPCLTFVTPSLLAGDKSLLDVVAHEITHSWTGNLVTNKNFEHFWLNEGFTVFLERKISAKIFGKEFEDFGAIEGWNYLVYDVKLYGENSNRTKLIPDLKGLSADDSCTLIPYEKGSTFLIYLQGLLGGPEIFEEYLRAYIQEFKYKSLDTDTWKEHLYKYFSDKAQILDTVDWEAWLHTPGMPPFKPEFDKTMILQCEELSKLWLEASEDDLDKFSEKDLEPFAHAKQIQEFVAILLLKEPLSVKKIEKMNEAYKLLQRNDEILYRFIRLGLICHWDQIIPHAVELVKRSGRMKYIEPIYKDMYDWDVSRETAVATFKETSSMYMHCAVVRVSNHLHLNSADF